MCPKTGANNDTVFKKKKKTHKNIFRYVIRVIRYMYVLGWYGGVMISTFASQGSGLEPAGRVCTLSLWNFIFYIFLGKSLSPGVKYNADYL